MKGILLTVSVIICVVLLSGFALPAVEAGDAKGKLTINGEATQIRYVYARRVSNDFDESKMETEVIFSDVPLSGLAARRWGVRAKLAREGKLTCIDLRISDEKKVIHFSLWYPGMKRSLSGSGHTGIILDADTFNPDSIAGTMNCECPIELFGKTIDLEITFTVNINN